MKITKRIFSAVVALIMVMAVTVCVSADSNFNQASASEANLVIGTVNITQAGSVTVPVKLNKNPGIYALNLQIKYDSSLTFSSISVSTEMAKNVGLNHSVSNNVITVLLESVNNNSTTGIKNFTATGTLLNIAFTSNYTKGSSFPVEFTKIDRKSVVNEEVEDITDSLTYCDGGVVCSSVTKPTAPVISKVAYSAANKITVAWKASTGATSYDVYRGTTKIKTVTATSYVDTVKTAGTVKYQVVAKNSAGSSAKSAAKSIKTMNFSAKPIVKGAPGKKLVTVKVSKKITNANGYQYQASLKKNMKSAKKATSTKTSAKIKKLKAKKIYYVRARAYKTINGKKVYGAWSKVVKLKKKTK